MKALAIERCEVTREKLLALAEQTPGAWLGLKVAVLVLLLDGYRHMFLTRLFGLSRMTLTRWVHRLNQAGVPGVLEHPRPGRPTALTGPLAAPTVAALGGDPRAARIASGGLGWSHLGGAPAAALWSGVDRPPSAEMAASLGLSVEAGQLFVLQA